MRHGVFGAALLVLLTILPPATAQDPTEFVRDLELRVLDLELRTSDLAGTRRTIEYGEEVAIALAADVLFAFDSPRLSNRASATLREVGRELEVRASGVVRVEGHTDSRGSSPYNLRLSERRAAAVRVALSRLVDKSGVSYRVAGFGESRPTAPNIKPNGRDNPQGRALNRRVEIRFAKD